MNGYLLREKVFGKDAKPNAAIFALAHRPCAAVEKHADSITSMTTQGAHIEVRRFKEGEDVSDLSYGWVTYYVRFARQIQTVQRRG